MQYTGKITTFLFYLGILQFIAAVAVMTGNKTEIAKTTRVTTTATPTTSDQETLIADPTILTSIPGSSNSTSRIVTTTQLFALEEPCKVNDSSSNTRTFNCSSLRDSARGMHCSLNSRLVGESCLCNKGYRKFPFSDSCVKEQGQPCLFQANDCSTELTNMACINNICSCEHSDIYDNIASQCVGRVQGLCYPGIKNCTLNAECVDVPTAARQIARRQTSSASSTSYNYYHYQTDQVPLTDYVLSSDSDIELSGRCQCKDGFVESRDGLCKKTYGQTCSSAFECDRLNLVCKEGLCVCPDVLQVYDLLSQSCVALVGAKCSDEPGGTLCVKLAVCQKINLKMEGRCVCVEGTVETNIRTCTHASLPMSPFLTVDPRNKNEQSSSRILFKF